MYSRPIIQNIAAVFKFNKQLDLSKFSRIAYNIEYNPRKFSGVIMRLRKPSSVALIFSNGKCVVTGTKTESDSIISCRRFARIIMNLIKSHSELDTDPTKPTVFVDFRITNITASFSIGRLINLYFLAAKKFDGVYIFYEPERFPSLILNFDNNEKIKISIFKSGKVNMTGFQKSCDVNFYYEKFKKLNIQN